MDDRATHEEAIEFIAEIEEVVPRNEKAWRQYDGNTPEGAHSASFKLTHVLQTCRHFIV